MKINYKNAGFTLLEVVIAVTILTLITLIVGYSFRLGINAWEKGEQEAGWTQRFRVLSGLLSQQIKSAYPYKMEIDDEKVILFKGESNSIVFVTTIAEKSYGGFKWVRYSHKDGTLFHKEGLLPDKNLPEHITGDEEVVDNNLEEIKFTFFSNDDGEWKESWDYEEKLPGAVKVKMSYFEPFLITIPMSSDEKQEEKEEDLVS